MTGAGTTGAGSLAIPFEPALPRFFPVPSQLLGDIGPTAEVRLARRLAVEGDMRERFVVLARVEPTSPNPK